MNVVDSSAWLEYFADGPNTDFFAEAIESTDELLVPTICILEVFKVVTRQRDSANALQAVALMQQGEVVDLDSSLAILAARLGLEHRLPLADGVVLATARSRNAIVWTQDEDFDGLENVRFKAKRP